MTTGNNVSNDQVYAPYKDIYGTAQPGSYPHGGKQQRTWTGGNAKATKVVTSTFIKKGVTYKKSKVVFVKYDADKRKKRDSFLAPQAYSMTKTHQYLPMGQCYIQQRTVPTNDLYSYVYWTDFTLGPVCPGNLPPLPVFPNATWNALINRLDRKTNGSDFNMSVFLGEGHQTLRLIGDTAIAVAEAYRSVRKGRVADGFRILAERSTTHGRRLRPLGHQTLRGRTPAEWWLELQYGWKPLLGDMKSAAEMLSQRLTVPFVQRVCVRETVNSDFGGKYNDSWPQQPQDGTIVFKNAKASVSKQIIGYFKESDVSSLPVLTGLLDPELVLWELMPFSFVIDWALPIGDWLQARAHASHMTGTFVTTTYTQQSTGGGDYYPANTWLSNAGGIRNNVLINTFSPKYVNTSTSVVREVSGSLSAARPQFKSLSDTLSLQHCLNGLALLTGMNSGRNAVM